MLWPLPDDFVEDPHCAPAALRTRYVLVLTMLAAVNLTVHDRATLDQLASHCRIWGMPSPYHPRAPLWARTQLADQPAAQQRQSRKPAAPVIERAGSPGAD